MKKLYLSILYVVSISLVISGTILFSKPEKVSRIDTSSSGVLKVGLDISEEEANAAHKKNKTAPITNKEISVSNNTPSFNLHAALKENEQGLKLLSLTYKHEGKHVKKVIDASQINEIRRIAPNLNNDKNCVAINNLQLNSKVGKLYISFQCNTTKGYTYSAIYSYNLSSAGVEKIYSQAGYFKNFSISPDKNYYAFSCMPQTHGATDNKAASVVIFKCSTNSEIFNSSREMRKLEMDAASEFSYYYMYSYYLKRWGSGNTCELNKGIISKDGREAPVSKSILLNLRSGAVIE